MTRSRARPRGVGALGGSPGPRPWRGCETGGFGAGGMAAVSRAATSGAARARTRASGGAPRRSAGGLGGGGLGGPAAFGLRALPARPGPRLRPSPDRRASRMARDGV